MKYEILNESGEVVNTILAEQWFVDKYHPGKYREVVEIIVPTKPIILPPIITKLAMMLRFTESEYMAALTAAKTDVSIEMWLDYLHASVTIDLLNDRVKKGVEAMLAKNILTSDRASAILNDPVQDNERP